MDTIVAHNTQLSVVYSGSPMLVHIASRRQTQCTELKAFLSDVSRRITDTTRRENSDPATATAHATAA